MHTSFPAWPNGAMTCAIYPQATTFYKKALAVNHHFA
jgi:hypothetical protein